MPLVLDSQGDVIGSWLKIPEVPGTSYSEPLYVGWAHDWDEPAPNNEYNPVAIGGYTDRETLIKEIERRAYEATT